MSNPVRVEQAPAYVIHQRRYRETSALLEVLTRDHGRVGLVARGLRSQRSRLRSTVQPFKPLLLSWVARGELGTLTGAEVRGPAGTLRGERLVSGLYLNELVYRLCGRDDPHPGLFDAYAHALAVLQSERPYEAALRIFEKRLLEAIGYGLRLDRTGDTGASLDPDATYAVLPEQGPVRVGDGPGPAGRGAVIVTGATLHALASETLVDADQCREAKHLMREALAPYLGGRPLASRRMFRPERSPEPPSRS